VFYWFFSVFRQFYCYRLLYLKTGAEWMLDDAQARTYSVFHRYHYVMMAPLLVGVKTRPILRKLKFWKLMNPLSQNQKMNDSG